MSLREDVETCNYIKQTNFEFSEWWNLSLTQCAPVENFSLKVSTGGSLPKTFMSTTPVLFMAASQQERICPVPGFKITIRPWTVQELQSTHLSSKARFGLMTSGGFVVSSDIWQLCL